MRRASSGGMVRRRRPGFGGERHTGLRSSANRWRMRCGPNQVRRTLHLDLQAAAVRSELYKRNAVRAERQCEDGSWDMEVELDSTEIARTARAPRAYSPEA